jgi:pilus assembly protein CpaC
VVTPVAEPTDATFSLGEFFQFGPFPDVLKLKEVYVNRKNILQIFTIPRDSMVVQAVGKELGVVQVTLVGQNGFMKPVKVRIAPSLALLRERAKRQFPQANLSISAVGDNLILLEGTVDSPADIEPIYRFLKSFTGGGEVINALKVTGVQQVQLQVCIAKMDRTAMRSMGVNFMRADVGNIEISQPGNLAGVPIINARGGATPNASNVFQNFAGGNTPAVLTPSSTFFYGLTGLGTSFFAFIEALQEQGQAKILATPTLVTLNGRPADFLVGGEQPVPVVTSASGTLLPSVDYKAFGTRLTFVPVILGDGRIRLNLIPEVSTLNGTVVVNVGATLVPQFLTQRVNATVEMESGQTLALGGLLQTEEEATVTKVPVLGDIPFAGVLFRRITHTVHEQELLVLVTPTLVSPMRGCQEVGRVPGQESRSPNDCELYLKGYIEVPVDPLPKNGFPAALHGSAGHGVPAPVVPEPVVPEPAIPVVPQPH